MRWRRIGEEGLFNQISFFQKEKIEFVQLVTAELKANCSRLCTCVHKIGSLIVGMTKIKPITCEAMSDVMISRLETFNLKHRRFIPIPADTMLIFLKIKKQL